MDKLTFPQFPAAELVNFFRQKVLTGAEAKNFTKADIYPNPKPEWILKLFMRVLQRVFNIGVEQFYMVPMDLDIQYPHLMEGFAPSAYIVKLMARFLPMCLIYDFHPSDVLNPKGKRALYLLSGIVNFLHFRVTRQMVYTSVCLSYKSALDNIHQHQKTIQELEAKIEKLTTVPPEQQAEFKALSSDIHDLQQSINQEYRTKDLALQEKIAHQKADFAEKMKKVNQNKLNIATMKEEQDTMKSQIVESPEQRKNKTERMKENVHRLKQARQETSEKCDHYRERVTVAGLWLSDVQAYNKKQHSIETHMEIYRKILEELRQKEEQIMNENREMKSMVNEESQLKRTNLTKKEKLAKMDIKNQKKQEDFEHRKNEILEICSHIQEKRQAVHGRVSHVLQEIQQTTSRKQQQIEMAEEEKKKYKDLVSGFKSALEKYHESMIKTTNQSGERRREKVAKLNRRLIRQ
ncbi:kinetochore protein Nuf2 [Hyla sarda]|uniref:kinetochore protein Nuf2 n=1 Tax=Hyla sarda TaxID=327740 RepID=UPI0024C368AB|nr:kinetochore protein Nuf2 [Hyla sarda]XP_056379276.1 kinetochore protein Nuf2 [Hyla sarda]XP_056379277.1 kinetochore protein Nuf2 [Hyla sarda]XP_056379278.1 kinetochore protein Nuf2 [Hyla sarda]